MKKYLPLCLFASLLVLTETNAQLRTISGRLTDHSGEPLIGAAILVKGTTNGTVTDIDGNYTLTVTVGSTLVISYTGFGTREVIVLDEEATPTTKTPAADAGLPEDQPSSARLDAGTATYIIGPISRDNDLNALLAPPFVSNYFPYQTSRIKYISPPKARRRYGQEVAKGFYLIDSGSSNKFGLKFNYSTAFAWNSPTRLPERQKTFAQGRPQNGSLHWRGPETDEPFSWGPPIANLEYDRIASYPYDSRGRLVLLGTGNGQAATNHDPYDFFTSGSTAVHQMDLKLHYQQKWFARLGYEQLSERGIVPGAKSRTDHFKFTLERKSQRDNLRLKYHLDADGYRNRLNDQGANLANLFYTIATTPPSFDNQNGLSANNAAREPGSYTTSGGQMRSFQPGQTANPYFLINQNVNGAQKDRMQHYAGLDWDANRFHLSSKMSYGRSRTEQRFAAFAPGNWEQSMRSSHRNSKINNVYAQLNLQQLIYFGNRDKHKLDARLIGEFFYDQFDFQRTDEQTKKPALDPLNTQLRRSASNVLARLSYHFDEILNIDLQNTTYFSNTLNEQHYFNPTAGVSLQTNALEYVDYAKVYGSFSRTLTELPVYYTTLDFNTLDTPSDQFQTYFEQGEVFYRSNLLPELSQKLEIGGQLDLFYHSLRAAFAYYDQRREQAIFPVLSGMGPTLINGADIQNRGIEASLNYRLPVYKFRWAIALNYSRNRSEVTKLHSNDREIPIAGFTDIRKSLIEGQPVGVLVGTRFARDQVGNTLIGPDGYPIVDDQTGIIGDPNPDWTAGMQNNLEWKSLKLSFLITLQKGGDIWNGTQNVMNYHGTSQLTAAERNTRDFIFPGVNAEGKINNIAVRFADPQQALADNRWVRYGRTGVAEEAIENASWVRLRDLSLQYTFPRHLLQPLHLSTVSISAFAKNLFLISRYRGLDPNTSLFGYQHGQGLDLFNLPTVRSFGLKLNVTL